MSSRASSVVSSIRNTRRVSWIAQCTGVGVLRHEQTHMVNSHNNNHNTSTNTNAYVCIYIYIYIYYVLIILIKMIRAPCHEYRWYE